MMYTDYSSLCSCSYTNHVTCHMSQFVKNRKTVTAATKGNGNGPHTTTDMSTDILHPWLKRLSTPPPTSKHSPLLPRLGYQLLREAMSPRPVVDRNSRSRTAAFCDFATSKIGIRTCIHTVDLALVLFQFVLTVTQVVSAPSR